MNNLEKAIKRVGITPSELARKIGKTRQCVSIAMKKGIRNADAAERYAAALCCTPSELMEFRDSARSRAREP